MYSFAKTDVAELRDSIPLITQPATGHDLKPVSSNSLFSETNSTFNPIISFCVVQEAEFQQLVQVLYNFLVMTSELHSQPLLHASIDCSNNNR
jgi:hypothetical protein